jgi:hypothetical protein
VDDAEIAALAARLGLEIDAFEAQYVRTVAGHKSLIEYANGDCVFFDGQTRGCTVYEDRPIQCRTWPFWDSNLQDRSSWRETCQVCPGSGQGPLYPLAEIEVRRRQREV